MRGRYNIYHSFPKVATHILQIAGAFNEQVNFMSLPKRFTFSSCSMTGNMRTWVCNLCMSAVDEVCSQDYDREFKKMLNENNILEVECWTNFPTGLRLSCLSCGNVEEV